MAIITCLECGKAFYNKALSCPNCGAPTSFSDDVKEQQIDSVCSECGNSVTKDQVTCNRCGNPIGRIQENESQGNIENVENATKKSDSTNTEADAQINNIKNAENSENEGEKSSSASTFFMIVFLAILIFTGVFISINIAGPRNAINLVKNYEEGTINASTIDENVKDWVSNDPEVVQVYGWEAEKVSDNTYLVSFRFDDDNDKTNGWMSYNYEAELNSKIVRSISANTVLFEKYRELGFFE